MEKKQIGDVTANDGKGFLDNEGLCDSLINDLNNSLKLLANGQYIQFCAIVTGMAQKLLNLKKGIKTDMDSMRGKVEELKRTNDELAEQLFKVPVTKEGDDDGGS